MPTVRPTRASVLIVLGTVMLTGAWSLRAEAQPPKPPPPLIIASMTGKDLFQFYCAPCHGRDAKGNGPVAASLAHRPADLTTIAARRGGVFPRQEMQRFVSGEDRATPAHGSQEMPVWGPIFRSLDTRDTVTRVRVANVIEFLESLQAK